MFVTAYVRKVGAIGIFYSMNFIVMWANKETYKDMWREQFGDKWELHHFVKAEQSS